MIVSYPFRPGSTRLLLPGQFWGVPISDGRFACGRVLQVGGSEIPTPTRVFFGGLLHWLDSKPPSVESIAGAKLLSFEARQHNGTTTNELAVGMMHIKAIAELGGQILGHRALEDDGIELPTLLSAHGGEGTEILFGANTLRTAKQEEWGKLQVLEAWGYDFIQQLAEHHLAGVALKIYYQ